MTRQPAPTPDDPAQYKRFLELAEKVGANGSASALQEAVKAVASHPRVDRKDKTGAKKRDTAK